MRTTFLEMINKEKSAFQQLHAFKHDRQNHTDYDLEDINIIYFVSMLKSAHGCMCFKLYRATTKRTLQLSTLTCY